MEKALPQTPEQLIPDRPHLKYIERTLALLESEKGPDGEDINWKDLYEQVGNWESGLELSDKIRNIVMKYLASKIPKLKDKIPSIRSLPEDKILLAVGQGWFENLGEEIGGTRKEVLLAVVANILRKIETRIFKKIFEQATEADFKKLGVPLNMRNLLISLLDISAKSSPLFIRFLAYSQLAQKLQPVNKNEDSENDQDQEIYANPLGQDGKPHTWAELFPHETQFISKRLEQIVENKQEWDNEPNAKEFEEYIRSLRDFFAQTDIEKTQTQYDDMAEKGKKLISTEFPIIISPPTGSYYMPPYVDPELRLSIRTPESAVKEKKFELLQDDIVSALPKLDITEFSEEMKNKVIRSYISVGPHGSGITFNEPAEVDKGFIVLYLNEQINKYDRGLKEFLLLIEGYEEAFGSLPEQLLKERIEEVSQEGTMSHEISHAVYFEDTPEAQRLGPDAEAIIAEVAADSIANGLTSFLINKMEAPNATKQEALATISIPLQVLERSDPDDEYFKAAVYTLNSLLEKGIVVFDGKKIRITDYDRLSEELREGAKKIIKLYRDKEMTPEKAEKWITDNCTANEKLQKVIGFVKNLSFQQ